MEKALVVHTNVYKHRCQNWLRLAITCHRAWAGGCFVTIEPLLGDTSVTFSAKNWEQYGQRPDSVLAAASGAIGKWADCQHQ